MKNSYSRYNLLSKVLKGSDEKKSWLDYFFSSKYCYLEISLPYYDFLRGKIFLQDLRDVFDKDVPLLFDINNLFDLLYFDFLNQVKKGVNYSAIASFLLNRKYIYLSSPVIETQVMTEIKPNLFTLESVEEEEGDSDNSEKYAYITLRIKSSVILRGEVFLHDLSPYMKEEDFTIEDLFTILYLDFIQKIKENGNNLKVMRSILSRVREK
ncbi:hypothetical protein [Metabacillus fastidiosus]|uniref:Uncharacterized protein n=1 Tax=Metabacillus fastidiosus TaxID=1458 RepID=A0ABU6NUC7_9BACI|nr:hypothetical protein [Metabacillus fastidiosus]MED4400308.1 hypothetical protein [Metabacillus fastidiosus]